MPRENRFFELLICIKNDGYPASLELRKVYKAIRDDAALAAGYVRVVDETGEDYLFSQGYFIPFNETRA